MIFSKMRSVVATLCLSAWSHTALADGPPGFLFVNATVTDMSKLAQYGQALPPVYAKYGGEYVIFGGVGRGVEVLAGSPMHESLIFAQFSSLEDVEKFWWSDDYRAVVPLREGAGRFDVLGLRGTGEEPYKAKNGIQPAYLFTLVKVKDEQKTAAYMEAISDYAASAPNRLIALSRPDDLTILEGPQPEFALEISSWPSLAAIKNFVSDPRFTATNDLRNEAVDFLLLAAEVAKPLE